MNTFLLCSVLDPRMSLLDSYINLTIHNSVTRLTVRWESKVRAKHRESSYYCTWSCLAWGDPHWESLYVGAGAAVCSPHPYMQVRNNSANNLENNIIDKEVFEVTFYNCPNQWILYLTILVISPYMQLNWSQEQFFYTST